MKNIFNKENLKPIIVLGAICLVVAALMGAVNMVTGPIIERAEQQKIYDSLRVVLDGEFDPIELPADAPSTVTGLYKVTDKGEFKGNVVTVSKQGYASVISLTIGIDKDGKITKVVVTGQQETHGQDISPLINGFASKSESEISGVEHVTNATKTSDYIKEAVADAFKVIGSNDETQPDDNQPEEEEKEILPKTDEEIIALAKKLVGEGAEFTDITPDGLTTTKRVYRENSGKGYVAYTLVINSRYETIETETLVFVDTNGKIKGIDRLTWKTSDAGWGYEPPTEDKVNPLYDRLVGYDADGLRDLLTKVQNKEDVLVSNATSTSTALVNSIIEALDATKDLPKIEKPMGDDDLKALASALAGGASMTEVNFGNATYVKKVYADGENGYVLYFVIISKSYGTVETEALIHVGSDGKIKGVNKLVCKTSDAIYGYVPPTEEAINAFFGRLVGTGVSNIDGVELISNATNTSNNAITAVKEALDIASALAAENVVVTNTARVVGIAVLSVIILASAAAIALPTIIRRKRV